MRVTATSTKKYPLVLKWKCSNCGCENYSNQWIKASVSITRKYPSEEKQAKMQKQASEDASEALKNKINAFADKIAVGDFSEYEFRCKCKECGSIEPWAKYNFKGISDTFGIVAILVGLVGLVGMMDSNFAIITIVLVASALFYSIVALMKRDLLRKVRELPFNSIPVFYDIEGNKLVAMQKYYEEKKSNDVSNKNSDNSDSKASSISRMKTKKETGISVEYCYHCGAKLLEDAVYCEKCGTKVR